MTHAALETEIEAPLHWSPWALSFSGQANAGPRILPEKLSLHAALILPTHSHAPTLISFCPIEPEEKMEGSFFHFMDLDGKEQEISRQS